VFDADIWLISSSSWSDGVMVRAMVCDSYKRSPDRLPTIALLANNTRQVVHTHCASVSKQYNLVPLKGGDALWLGR